MTALKSSSPLPSHRWQDLTTQDFASLDAARTVAVLPLGATEQHGPHLPLSVDTDLVEGVVRAALGHLALTDPVLVLPTQQVSLSTEHMAFAGMGLGLATPYLLASWMPAVAQRLPHPGPWMITLRQLLGFPMLATVAWLLWVLGQQTSLDATMAVLGGLLLLAASVWARQHPHRMTRVLSGLLALTLVVGTVQLSPLLAESASDPAPLTNATWQPWSEDAVANALQSGRPVFVDFTAAWCVTCQINKKATLSNAEVLSDFAAHQVTLLRADWTRRDPHITAALTRLGRSGVPVYVLYIPNQAPVVLSELLSPAQIHDALQALPPAKQP